MNRVIIHHHPCTDGIVAAWAVTKHPDWADAELIPANYGDDPPDVKGKHVVIVDFSYSRETLLQMHKEAASLLVLDHHATAQEALEGLDFCIFDMERSGAGLAWDHFHPGRPRPFVVAYAEDRDLWRFKLPDSKAINSFLKTVPLTVPAVEMVTQQLDIEKVKTMGLGCLGLTDYLSESVAKAAYRVKTDSHYLLEAQHKHVRVVNCIPMMASDALNYIIETTGCDMAIGWSYGKLGIGLSLRAPEGGVHVGNFARDVWGGGGHPRAAGAKAAMLPMFMRRKYRIKEEV